MIYIFLIVCVCVYVFAPDCTAMGVTIDSLNHAYIYQFAHASWLHLGINALSMLLIFKPILHIYEERFGETSQTSFLLLSYLGSVLAALLTAQDIPTVGMSGMVFFLIGELVMLRPNQSQIISLVYMSIAIIVQFIRGKSNVSLHIVAFVLGALFIILRLLCKRHKERFDSIDG